MCPDGVGNFAQITVRFQMRRAVGLFGLSLISGLGLAGRLGQGDVPLLDYCQPTMNFATNV